MQDSFEVGEEVVAAFAAAGFDTRAICRQLPSPTLPKLTAHIDLVAANTTSLLSAGLSLENICACGICTYTHYARFFSARRLGIRSGRIYSGIMVAAHAIPSNSISKIRVEPPGMPGCENLP